MSDDVLAVFFFLAAFPYSHSGRSPRIREIADARRISCGAAKAAVRQLRALGWLTDSYQEPVPYLQAVS